MKALVKYEKGLKKVRLENVIIPEPGSDEVRIKVKAAGICGTDIHIYNDESYPAKPPVILGHEVSGIIDIVGKEVKDFKIGQKVVSETYYYTCGKCCYCKTGKRNLCMERLSIGSGVDGAMAEYVVVPASNLHIIPENISFEEAAMIEPLACCVQAVMENCRILPGEKVLITGPGCIGLLCLQVAKLFGTQIIVVGTPSDNERLKIATELGADLICSTSELDIKSKISDFCGGAGPDIILECSGSEKAINFCLDIIRKGGRYKQVGLSGKAVLLDINKVTLKEIQVSGTFAQKWVWWEKSIELLSERKIQLKPLLSKAMPLDNWKEAFDKYTIGEGLKYILIP